MRRMTVGVVVLVLGVALAAPAAAGVPCQGQAGRALDRASDAAAPGLGLASSVASEVAGFGLCGGTY